MDTPKKEAKWAFVFDAIDTLQQQKA